MAQDKLIADVKSLSEVFFGSLSRCNVCGKMDAAWDCQYCRANRERFNQVLSNLLEHLTIDPTKRKFLELYGIDPCAEDAFPLGLFVEE
jgi:hypothetical protein